MLKGWVAWTFALGLCASVYGAAPLPTWVKSPPLEDARFYYVLGRASGWKLDKEKDAYNEAYEDATKTFFRQVIGVNTKAALDSYSTAENAKIVNRSTEESVSVQIKLVPVESFKQESPNGTWNLSILYKQDKNEIEKQRRRITQSQDEQIQRPIRLLAVREDDLYGERPIQIKKKNSEDVLFSDLPDSWKSAPAVGLFKANPWGIYLVSRSDVGYAKLDESFRTYSFGISAEKIIFNQVGLKFTGLYVLGDGSIDTKGSAWLFSAPIYFSLLDRELEDTMQKAAEKVYQQKGTPFSSMINCYIEPEIGFTRNTRYKQYIKVGNGSELNPNPYTTFSQYYYGLSFGFQWAALFPLVFDGRIGYGKFSNQKLYEGAAGLTYTVAFLWRL